MENHTPIPAANGEKKPHRNDRGRRRHGKGSKPHHHANPEAKSKGATLDKGFFAGEEQAKKEERSPEKRESEKRKNKPHPHQQGGERPENAQKKDGKNGKKGRSHGKGHPRRQNEHRPYDPYEEVAPEELSLAELRSRIVIRAEQSEPTDEPLSPSLPEAEEVAVSEEAVAALLDEKTPEEDVERVEVVGVRFRSAGKTYYFDPHGIKVKKGAFVIVETARGAEFGEVSLSNTEIPQKNVVSPLRPICRIATAEDVHRDEENRRKEKDALAVCQKKVEAHKLDMKLIDVQYAFDNSKLLFYFTAEGRVDFRELVKDLASTFRTRIELRQIGIRDEAKLLGGLGACGRSLCCSTFLPDFAQVSIKMAKDQSLSLNSSKISGLCGRLMCCLRYEQDVYVEEIRKTPSNDTLVKTEDGIGTVISSNPLAGTVRVVLKDSPDTPPKQYHRDDLTVIGKGKRENRENAPKKEENGEKEERS